MSHAAKAEFRAKHDDLFMAFRVPGLAHLREHRGELETALAKEGAAS